MSLREELIQVAAVAVAHVEQLEGSPENRVRNPNGFRTDWHQAALDHVGSERFRQWEKWGPRKHTDLEWLMILMEEVGEVADEIAAEQDPVLSPVMDVLGAIQYAGSQARRWLENHEWPERQQQVFDEELSE